MTVQGHISRGCAKCGGQLQEGVETCPWCKTPLAGAEQAQRIRVRKKRSVLKTYYEHVRRHWLLFFLAIVAGLVAAWLLLDFAKRPSRQSSPAPAALTLPLSRL